MGTRKRQLFVFLWSTVSVLGIFIRLLYVPVNTGTAIVLYYMTGFHVPQDAIYWFDLFGLFTNYPELCLLFILFGVGFLVLWIVALLRLKRGYMFERLILFDRVSSLFILVFVMIVLGKTFDGWYLLTLSCADILVVIVVSIIIKKRYSCVQDAPKFNE